MSAKRWISFPKSEGDGIPARGARGPAGGHVRARDGQGRLFGPPRISIIGIRPRDGPSFTGALNPHAYDLNRLPAKGGSTVGRDAVHGQRRRQDPVLENGAAGDGSSRAQPGRRRAPVRPRGRGRVLSATGDGSTYRDGDYIVIPRGGMWRIAPSPPTTLLLIECTEGTYTLPEKGLVGPQAIFDPAMLDVPAMDAAISRAADGRSVDGRSEARRQAVDDRVPVQPAGRGGLARRPLRRAPQLSATSGR